jgi:hypothetical protein
LFHNSLRYLKSISIILAVGFIGCSSSQDKTAAGDLAQRVHSRMQSGDFATIYKESAPRLKSASTESEFVDYFKDIQNELGSLKQVHEIAYESRMDSRTGRANAFMFQLDYERGRLYETMTLVRSDSGQMQLWKLGIGSDPPPKNWASE